MKKSPKKKYELLAPAGNFFSLVTAVNAGADAIYFGLKELNMRAGLKGNSRNFKIQDLGKIKKICDAHGVKKYLTLNTIIYDKEIEKVEEIIKKSKKYIDAIICWDLAVIELCRKYKVDFHISTQASVANIESAKFYKKLGAKRIILARELNLNQIKKISRIINVEVFIHGAMCVSISGRCFTSQFLFNKSANRGQCIHPCRREYVIKDEEGNELKLKNNTIMSAKDLCALPFIERLKKAGIKAFKIEGRSREPEYVDAVVRVYRKAIDKKLNKREIASGIEELKKVYNKGFSSGFLIKEPTNDDFSMVENSSSEFKKEFVGRVEHYYPKIDVAAVKILSGNIKIGSELIIISKYSGVKKCRVVRMEINHKSIKMANKGQFIGIKIGKVKRGDSIYKIVKK